MHKRLSIWPGLLLLGAALGGVASAGITKVVNGASFAPGDSFSPGTIVTILGTDLAPTAAPAPDPTHPPRQLAGVTVTVDGIASPLFYVSPRQINASIDTAVTAGTKTLVVQSSAGRFTATIQIVPAGVPGIFSTSGSGARDAAVLNAVTFRRGPFTVRTAGQPTYLAIYATGIQTSPLPIVRIAGIPVLVLFAGNAPGFIGLQQINVQLPEALAGAGRVELVIASGTQVTNVVEIVILPSVGQGPFPPQRDDEARDRELASIAWVPGTSRALLTDENDDVVRVLDVAARKVVRTIALPEGAEPFAIAVDAAGLTAVVTERGRSRVALIDLAAARVTQEVPTGGGPSALAVVGNVALVVNSDTDNVTAISLATKAVLGTVAVGRSPRGIAGQQLGNLLVAYVTNQNDGTISIIDVGNLKVFGTLQLGATRRPRSIQILPALGVAAVTEPSQSASGKVLLVNTASGAVIAELNANAENTGGSSDMALWGDTVYFANQSGGSVTAAKVSLTPSPAFTPRSIPVGLGARSLAVDALDKLLLVANEGSGEVVLVDLTTNTVAGRINGVRAEDEDEDGHDNRDDHERAGNLPTIASMTPAQFRAPGSFILRLTGANLTGATGVLFVLADSLPGGRGNGNGNSNGNGKGRGPSGTTDPGLAATNIQVIGGTLTATVNVQAGAVKGDHVVRVLTANGESTFKATDANVFKVQ
jgi:uncharacterized protein (TIGR03437 family)